MAQILDSGGLVTNTSDAPTSYDPSGETVRQAENLSVERTGPPPKADAAVRASSLETFQGLVTLLNKQQQDFVNKKQQEFADEYEIIFVPESLKNATVAKPGTTAYNNTAVVDPNKPSSRDPDRNSTNMKSRTHTVTGGESIIQIINKIVKNSSYITDQMIKNIDEVTQEPLKNDKTFGNKNVSWFEISPVATPTTKFDKLRNDFAYKITYYVTKYEINRMVSGYFPSATYRGAHKAYNYWYTGENTSVLDLAIDYNATYQTYNVVASTPNDKSSLRSQQEQYTKSIYGDLPFQPTVSPQAASTSDAQGAKGKTNEGPASAEDFLFDPNALVEVKMTIVGDPAWLFKGTGIDSNRPPGAQSFFPDGTINFHGQELVFVLAFNSPSDYNLETGLMEVNRTEKNPDGTPKNLPQVAVAYRGKTITSTFSKGKFEQELEGTIIGSLKQLQTPSGANSSGREITNPVNDVRQSPEDTRISTLVTEPPEQTDPPQAITNADVGSGEIPNVLPSALVEPPTSTGLIEPVALPAPPTYTQANLRVYGDNATTQQQTDVNRARGENTDPQLLNREF